MPSYTWERNTGYLVERGYRTLSFDLYGRGFSARPDIEYDRSLFVSQIEELLDALDISAPVHLVGLSMGGAVVAAFAADYPEKVESLVFLAPFNSPIDIGPLSAPVIGEYIGYSFVVPGMPEDQLIDFVQPEQHPDWPDRFREQMRYEGFRNAILSTARGFIQSNPIIDFGNAGTTNPRSLLLWGDSDSTFPVEQADQVRAALGNNVQFETISSAGHALHYENSDEVNAHISAFLGAISPDIQIQPGTQGGS